MLRSLDQLRHDAHKIWRAGLQAVESERLIRQHVRIEGPLEKAKLTLGDETIDLLSVNRIVVVGAGKAGAGMAAALEEVLGEQLANDKQLVGWVNVPADCVRTLKRIRLHAARPPGQNVPTAEGIAGTNEILKLISSLSEDDLCIALFSGGGSALLPAPCDGVTLEDLVAVTRQLSAAGANIEQLNTVRRCLSRVKGGGLATACRAGRLVSLIISDVLGDPLEVIASGPTVLTNDIPESALKVLEQYHAREAGVAESVFQSLRQAQPRTLPTCQISHHILANNATAVDAAGMEAERLGYSHAMTSASSSEPSAEQVGRHLADMALHMREHPGPDCLISGGEPVVELVDAMKRGRGGRNQQLVLAALESLEDCQGIVLLSGGTDGEDGPTDAAGAWLDEQIAITGKEKSLDPADYLARNDAYPFFEQSGGLIKTGPTHTNVCDLRVVLVDRVELD